MGRHSKYIGKIYEGRWEVVSRRKGTSYCNGIYTLRNIFNGNTVDVVDTVLYDVDKGITSVSRIIRHRIVKEDKYHEKTFVF